MNKTIRRLALIGIAVPAFGLLGVAPADALLPPPTPEDPTDPGDTGGGASGGTSTYQATADFNGDGGSDSCVVTSADAKAACTVTTPPAGGTTGKNITYSTKVDPGWMAGRAWVDHNGDGKADYCRVVDYTRLACTVSTAPTVPPATAGYLQPFGDGFGATYYSQNLDAGWDDTRTWRDANGDGKADYCRITGNFLFGYQASCTISNGQGFTAESLRVYF